MPTLQELDAYWRTVAEADQRAVGRSFADILVPNVPGVMEMLARMPAVEAGEIEWLLDDPSVDEAGVSGGALARVGLTPLAITDASCAIRHLADRSGGHDRPVRLACRAGVEADIARGAIDASVGLIAETPTDRTAALVDLALLAMAHLPKLVLDYRSTREDDVVTLVYAGRDDDERGYDWLG